MAAIKSSPLDAIGNASNSIIIDSGIEIKNTSFPRNRWLFRNKYSDEILDKIKNEGINAPEYPKCLAQYIAASIVTHCFDGWNFFSCSIDSLLNGDYQNAIFMAYYAQIRSLMSFFAYEGIGVFNNKHFWFDSSRVCHFFGGKTHKVIWNLIETWLTSTSRNGEFFKILHYDNYPFSDWISSADTILGAPSSVEIEKDWLKCWSIDIKVLCEDQDSRNEVSYRPQRIFPKKLNNDYIDNLNTCVHLWETSEPVGTDRFSILDKYLLRNTLYGIFKLRNGNKNFRNKKYIEYISLTLSNMGKNANGELFDFLTYKSQPENLTLFHQSSKKGRTIHNGVQAIPIVTRAFLLLRLASATSELFLKKCSINKTDVDFWVNDIGESFGLWNSITKTENIEDLWIDVDLALQTINSNIQLNNGTISLIDSRKSNPVELWYIRQFTRAGLWAFGL